MPDSKPQSAESTMALRHRGGWGRGAAASLLIGLVLTVCGAWGMAALHDIDEPIDSYAVHERHGSVHVVGMVSVRRGGTVVAANIRDGAYIETVVDDYRSQHAGSGRARDGASPGTGTLPHWSSARWPARTANGSNHVGHLDWAYGWPMRSLMYSHLTPSVGVWGVPGNATTPRSRMVTSLEIHPRITLPYGPIWPGLLFNTLFYAAIWFALFTGLAAVRTARRLRRGLCPVCRYDLRGLPERACPECGWGRTPAARRAKAS